MKDPSAVERASRPDLERLQLARLRKLVARATERVPFYRERLRQAGVTARDVRSLADLRRLPFTTKTDFRDTYPFGMLAVPPRDVVRLHASSGTTGKPTGAAWGPATSSTTPTATGCSPAASGSTTAPSASAPP